MAWILGPAMMVFPRLLNRFNFRIMTEAESEQIIDSPSPDALRCRLELTNQRSQGSIVDVFNVGIKGTIHSPAEEQDAIVQIVIDDVTKDIDSSKPVHAKTKQWRKENSDVFRYQAKLGRLPNQETILSDWTSIAKIHSDWLLFPRRANLKLRFGVSILSEENRQQLACAVCGFAYDNVAFGYIDLDENKQRTKTLAVALAFIVSAVDKKLYKCEIELIKSWAKKSFDLANASGKARRKLEKALDKTVAFFQAGNRLDTFQICKELVEITPASRRYDVLELCLNVARANGVASPEEVALLKNIANWLEVDKDLFRSMMQKILPCTMHKVKDAHSVLGLDDDMSEEKTHRLLNKEYGKWNARVTNMDPEIRRQADDMLSIIAKARTRHLN
ncbi:TerB family tellurite resistance protein [Planctomycetota bacterium]